ncbi:MAG TPA: TAXI family TRAP transporter solute-binding subunit, partial [Albitalea sp.]
MRLRPTLTSLRELAGTAAPLVALALVLLALAYWVLDPTPPRRVVLATGVEQGAYAQFGQRYAQILRRNGITVELRQTHGAAENLALLRDPASGVDLAFVQGGADAERQGEVVHDGLVSLGSMFYEPVWLFYRAESARKLLKKSDSLATLSQLVGWKVNVGPQGSGVPPLMRQLLEANRIDPASVQLGDKALTPAVVDLLEGRIDALVM